MTNRNQRKPFFLHLTVPTNGLEMEEYYYQNKPKIFGGGKEKKSKRVDSVMSRIEDDAVRMRRDDITREEE